MGHLAVFSKSQAGAQSIAILAAMLRLDNAAQAVRGAAMTTLRDYIYIIVLLLALAATIGLSYSKLLTGLTERTVAQVRVRR